MSDPFAPVVAQWPPAARSRFAEIRTLILSAAQNADAGPLAESLKWGQPAWRPTRARQGSTLRLMWQDTMPQTIALFVDCKTTLSETMRDIYPSDFQYEKNRGLRMDLTSPLPEQAIDHLARLTFTYHHKA